MKKVVVFVIVAVGLVTLVSFGINQNQVPYLSIKLSPYSEDLNLVPSNLPKDFFKIETYTKLETGLEDFKIYVGTGETSVYWMKIESLLGEPFSVGMKMEKDESLNIRRNTINHKFNGDSAMIAFEMIHYLSTDEIQYIWLDDNNNRSEKLIIIPLDYPLKKGKEFLPDLTVELLNGEKLSFNDLIGKTIVVNWWATTCAPCIVEMPGLNKLVEQYKENPNVVFIAIAHDKKEDVTRFLESREYDYIQTLSNNDAVELFGESYPKHVIINSERRISYYSIGGGQNTYLEIEKNIKELLE